MFRYSGVSFTRGAWESGRQFAATKVWTLGLDLRCRWEKTIIHSLAFLHPSCEALRSILGDSTEESGYHGQRSLKSCTCAAKRLRATVERGIDGKHAALSSIGAHPHGLNCNTSL